MEKQRITALDSIRGIAAIGIAIFWHYQHFKPDKYPFSQKAYWLYQYGWTLVDLFFVISGFIFAYKYKDSIIEGIINFKEFFILRFCRLYPLIFITLIAVTFLQALRMVTLHNFFQYHYNDLYHFLLNIFCIQSGWFEDGYSFNAPTWSVSCEVVVYIIFYILLYKIKDKKKCIIGYIVMIFMGIGIIKMEMKYPLINENIARALLGFFVGCCTCEVNKYINKSFTKEKIINSLFMSFIIIILSTYLYGHSILGNWKIVYSVYIYPMIILLGINSRVVRKVLSLKPLTYLGDISFSIYVWHFPIQLIIKTIDDIVGININYSTKLFFFSYVAMVLIVSVLSYELIEKNSNKYLRKIMLKRINTI